MLFRSQLPNKRGPGEPPPRLPHISAAGALPGLLPSFFTNTFSRHSSNASCDGSRGRRGGSGCASTGSSCRTACGGLLGVAGRLSGTVSHFRVEQGTSLETPSGKQCQTLFWGAPRDPRLDSRGERRPWLPLETRPDSQVLEFWHQHQSFQ